VNGSFKLTVIAQREVAERKVVQAPSARTTGEPRLVPGAPGPIGREFAPTSV
jgi:hypothetical protein